MTKRTWFGAAIIAVGAGFLLEMFGFWDFGKIISTWWPLLIILSGVLGLLSRSTPMFGSIVVILVGLWLQAMRLDSFPKEYISFFWPALIILIGIGVIFGRPIFGRPTESSEDKVDYFVAFSGIETRNLSRNFQGGGIMALFGGAEIDLRSAHLAHGGATLQITAAFGGAEISVPESWRVTVSGLPLFGGWENKTRYAKEGSSSQPTLQIKCLALFGGIEIKN